MNNIWIGFQRLAAKPRRNQNSLKRNRHSFPNFLRELITGSVRSPRLQNQQAKEILRAPPFKTILEF